MEVVGRYSKQPRPPDLGHITTCFGPVSSPSTIHNVRRRLGAEVISQLVHDYQAGVPTTELTVTYGIGKGTVLRLLRSQGVRQAQATSTAVHAPVDSLIHDTGGIAVEAVLATQTAYLARRPGTKSRSCGYVRSADKH